MFDKRLCLYFKSLRFVCVFLYILSFELKKRLLFKTRLSRARVGKPIASARKSVWDILLVRKVAPRYIKDFVLNLACVSGHGSPLR